MLKSIFVKDFAIIDRAEVALSAGMTVLTGETGAGKSLLVDALLLLTGARSDASMVRHGAERAELHAEFEVAPDHAARLWLQEQELDDDEGLRLRRIIRADGNSRAYINDRPCSSAQLRELCASLVEIHGQHEHQALLSKTQQLRLLDRFGRHETMLTRLAQASASVHQLQRQLQALESAGSSDPDRIEFLKFQLKELQRDGLGAERFQKLVDDHKRTSNASQLLDGSARLGERLDGDEGESLRAQLSDVRAELEKLASLDESLHPVLELIDAADIQLGEAADAIRRYRDRFDLDPAEFDKLDQQLARIHELARKHRVAPKELLDKAESIEQELARIEGASGERERLLLALQQAEKQYSQTASELSQLRADSARRLDAAVTAILHELAIAGAFTAALSTRSEHQFAASGLEEVEFLVSPNPGQPARPLRKIASGGELARISLAIEVATIGADEVPVMVFDEVDSGIGGATAEVVGRKLRELGEARQVLTVTHLPQVAALGHAHLRVAKKQDAGQTRTQIEVLTGKNRVEEVARMLGGIQLTTETKAHASAMLKAAAR
ncbi:DNA repair protein RecN [Ahniella affigens]|uniref:DNA repair protein RecN n=1 Tax=Ahniella affigens TaxID=2021234 RepID=A0A2P1PMC7_9GAMM|nr:DNA repair protein RecN [Ahniella affigens]AVP96003.1 DNA repair protein RecN [Ahniella affigens]